MKKMLSMMCFVFVSLMTLNASAQHVLPSWAIQGYFLVDSTENLFKIRAAVTHLFCDQSLAHGLSGCYQTVPVANGGNYPYYGYTREDYWSAPFDTVCEWGNCTDGKFAEGPWGASTGFDDCMSVQVPYVGQAWNGGWGLYLGQSSTIDVDPTEAVETETINVPSIGNIVAAADLPQSCIDYKWNLACAHTAEIAGWGISEQEWYTLQCDWGVTCCDAVAEVNCEGRDEWWLSEVCNTYSLCCP